MSKLFFILGSLFSGLGVALGAFGAHVLKSKLSESLLSTFETGVRYQMYHALALLAVSWLLHTFGSGKAVTAGYLFVAGILIFSGSLYVLSLTGVRWLGAITPVGGLCFLIGWILLIWAGWSDIR